MASTEDARSDSVGAEDEHSLAVDADPEAFALLYRRRHARVVGYFRRRIRCPQTAAELTAETFARLWATRGRFDPAKGSATAWTLGIASNLYRQWSQQTHRSAVARSRLAGERRRPGLDDEERIDALVDLAERCETLRAALRRLSPRVRAAVTLRVALDLPYAEVAARLGCSVGAARTRVSRGLDDLRAELATPTSASSRRLLDGSVP